MANKNNIKTKKCKVLNYIESAKILLVDFDGFGISFTSDTNRDFVEVKYSGNIGNKNFKCELAR